MAFSQSADDRARAEGAAASFYELVRAGRREEMLEGFEELRKEPLSRAEMAFLSDAVETARLAEAAGADAIHVSAYADSTSGVAFTDAPLVDKQCGYAEFAHGIKRALEIPVIAVGRIEPEEGDRLIAEGKADYESVRDGGRYDLVTRKVLP